MSWTIRQIARQYDVDPKTAHYWTQQDWFPKPTNGLYDPAEVRAAVRVKRRRRNQRNARIVRAYRTHHTIAAAATAGNVHRNTARKILRRNGEIQ